MRRPAVAAVVLVLTAGCSLPLPGGVHTAQGVPAEQRSGALLKVLPPGPKPGQTPENIVRGFVQAQANADDRHAIARSFLTSAQARAWDDTAEVQVFDLPRQQLTSAPAADGATVTVTVSGLVTGVIAADGGYQPRSQPGLDTYRLQRVSGQWRLSEVPPGLRLTAADLDRSYRPAVVYFLAPADAEGSGRVVPDRVFLPAGPDLPEKLVRRVLDEPSSALRGSVAHEPGLSVRRVTTDGAGVVTVDLGPSAAALSPSSREELSAQLVWTLKELGSGFSGLRLRSAGTALAVPGQGAVQDDNAWGSYDPEALGPNPPYLYVGDHRLRASTQLQLPSGDATAGDPGRGSAFSVDAVAVTPDRTQVALLDGSPAGSVTVRIGPLRGPSFPVAITARGLHSPSWGAGDRGLWLVQGNSLVLLAEGALQGISIAGPRPAGKLSAVTASRDGARLAVVIGGRLYVGRVEVTTGPPRLVGLAPVARGLTVTDAAFRTGTELVAVGRNGSGPAQLVDLAIDGSVNSILATPGKVPDSVTACSAGVVFSARGVLYSLVGRAPAEVGAGSGPAFPG